MEFTVALFWMITLIVVPLTLYSMYKAIVVYKFKSKLWNIGAFLLVVLTFVNPVKINGTNSNKTLSQQNYNIEASKTLPKRVNDTSFENSVNSVKSISDKEIWSK